MLRALAARVMISAVPLPPGGVEGIAVRFVAFLQVLPPPIDIASDPRSRRQGRN